MQHRLTDEEKIECVSLYLSGKYTCTDLATKYNVSKQAISGILKRRGIAVNNDQSSLQRKHSLDATFFNIIDSEEKSYILGFLYADGYNNEKRGNISISLIEDDIDILNKIQACMKSDYQLKLIKYEHDNWKNQYNLRIYSKKISQRLVELGCPQAKTFKMQFPTEHQVPYELQRHFIRGYFDGDGSFSQYWEKYKGVPSYIKACGSIVGTEDFCMSLGIILKQEIKVNTFLDRRHKDKDNNNRTLAISGVQQTYRFLNWIYEDSTIYMDRKYNKYKNFEELLISKNLVKDSAA